MAAAVKRIHELRDDLRTVQAKHAAAKKDDEGGSADSGEEPARSSEAEDDDGEEDEPSLPTLAREALERLEGLENELWTPPGTKGIVARDRALDEVGGLLGSLQSSWDAPNPTQRTRMRQVTELVDGLLERLREIEEGPVAEVRSAARNAEIELLPERDAVRIDRDG